MLPVYTHFGAISMYDPSVCICQPPLRTMACSLTTLQTMGERQTFHFESDAHSTWQISEVFGAHMRRYSKVGTRAAQGPEDMGWDAGCCTHRTVGKMDIYSIVNSKQNND